MKIKEKLCDKEAWNRYLASLRYSLPVSYTHLRAHETSV